MIMKIKIKMVKMMIKVVEMLYLHSSGNQGGLTGSPCFLRIIINQIVQKKSP